MLTNEQRNKIIFDRVSFDIYVHLEDGKLVEKINDDFYTSESLADEIPVPLEPLKVVNLKFNQSVYDRFVKYISTVYSKRGIKNIDEIDENDYVVKRLIAKINTGRKKATDAQISAIIERVKREHRPHTMLATFQVLIWSMLYEDIFNIVGNQLNIRLEINVPESYWEGAKNTDPLDIALSQDVIPAPYLDRNNILENMLAIVTTIQNTYPEFVEGVQEYFQKAFVTLGLLTANQQYDDAGFLNKRLDELL